MASPRRWLPALILIVVMVGAAWWVGVHTNDPPTRLHSLGVVARVCIGRDRCGAALGVRGNLGRDLPVTRRCHPCFTRFDVMRYLPGAGLRVDMVVKVHPRLFPYVDTRCGQATVDMTISGTPQFWQQHNRLLAVQPPPRRGVRASDSPPAVVTEVALGWDRFTRVTLPSAARGAVPGPVLARPLTVDPQAQLHPALYTDQDLLSSPDRPHVAPYPPADPLGVQVRMANWANQMTLTMSPLHVHFVANWLSPRGWGSCYVVLPSLLANGAFSATQNALYALMQRSSFSRGRQARLESETQPPSYGRTALSATGSLSLPDTNPPPTDYEAIGVDTHGTLQQRINAFVTGGTGQLGPVWACTPSDNLSYLDARFPRNIPATGSFVGNECGAIAVVDAPGASDIRATVLIILGVLLAIAFERLFSGLRPNEEEKSDRVSWV